MIRFDIYACEGSHRILVEIDNEADVTETVACPVDKKLATYEASVDQLAEVL